MYNGNGNTGGAVPSDAKVYQNSQTVAVLPNSGGLAKAGTHFIGWNTSPDGTGTERTTCPRGDDL
jgi:hypothetical protein